MYFRDGLLALQYLLILNDDDERQFFQKIYKQRKAYGFFSYRIARDKVWRIRQLTKFNIYHGLLFTNFSYFYSHETDETYIILIYN